MDAFRILAALLVVAIHISPLTTYSAAGDFFLTRCLARVAVPFFFMVTGHFVLGQVLEGKGTFAPLGRQVRKILLLYLVAVVALPPHRLVRRPLPGPEPSGRGAAAGL